MLLKAARGSTGGCPAVVRPPLPGVAWDCAFPSPDLVLLGLSAISVLDSLHFRYIIFSIGLEEEGSRARSSQISSPPSRDERPGQYFCSSGKTLYRNDGGLV